MVMSAFAIIAISFMGLYSSLIRSTIIAKRRAVATSLATGQMEYLKSLPYDSLAIAGGRFEPPTQVASDIPESLDAWFARAFRPHEHERFTSAFELWTTFLDAAQVSRTAAMSVASGLEPTKRAANSGPRPAPTVGVDAAESTSAARDRTTSPEPGTKPNGEATQRSSLPHAGEPEDDAAFQISRPSLAGASISAAPPAITPARGPVVHAVWKVAALAAVAAIGVLAFLLARDPSAVATSTTTPSAGVDGKAQHEQTAKLPADTAAQHEHAARLPTELDPAAQHEQAAKPAVDLDPAAQRNQAAKLPAELDPTAQHEQVAKPATRPATDRLLSNLAPAAGATSSRAAATRKSAAPHAAVLGTSASLELPTPGVGADGAATASAAASAAPTRLHTDHGF